MARCAALVSAPHHSWTQPEPWLGDSIKWHPHRLTPPDGYISQLEGSKHAFKHWAVGREQATPAEMAHKAQTLTFQPTKFKFIKTHHKMQYPSKASTPRTDAASTCSQSNLLGKQTPPADSSKAGQKRSNQHLNNPTAPTPLPGHPDPSMSKRVVRTGGGASQDDRVNTTGRVKQAGGVAREGPIHHPLSRKATLTPLAKHTETNTAREGIQAQHGETWAGTDTSHQQAPGAHGVSGEAEEGRLSPYNELAEWNDWPSLRFSSASTTSPQPSVANHSKEPTPRPADNSMSDPWEGFTNWAALIAPWHEPMVTNATPSHSPTKAAANACPTGTPIELIGTPPVCESPHWSLSPVLGSGDSSDGSRSTSSWDPQSPGHSDGYSYHSPQSHDSCDSRCSLYGLEHSPQTYRDCSFHHHLGELECRLEVELGQAQHSPPSHRSSPYSIFTPLGSEVLQEIGEMETKYENQATRGKQLAQ